MRLVVRFRATEHDCAIDTIVWAGSFVDSAHQENAGVQRHILWDQYHGTLEACEIEADDAKGSRQLQWRAKPFA